MCTAAAADKSETTRSATDPPAPIDVIWFYSLALFQNQEGSHNDIRQDRLLNINRVGVISNSSRCSSFIPEVPYHLL